MALTQLLNLGQTAIEIGLICSLTVLALFVSYIMLDVCDLSTDGCFTLGACAGATVAILGHPYLSIVAAMFAYLFAMIAIKGFDRDDLKLMPMGNKMISFLDKRGLL